MPSAEEILAGLSAIANGAVPAAVGWHVVLGAVLVALLAGWRPSQRVAGVALAVPLASVSLFAWLHANPFNGTVFLVLALALAGLGARLPRAPVRPGPGWAVAAGAAMVAFGWVYPHFLAGAPTIAYLYAAPTGLIPCPTLAAVTGLALLGGGLGARAWPLLLAAAGLLYGVIGALGLGVGIDALLLAGAAALLVQGLRGPGRRGAAITSDAARA